MRNPDSDQHCAENNRLASNNQEQVAQHADGGVSAAAVGYSLFGLRPGSLPRTDLSVTDVTTSRTKTMKASKPLLPSAHMAIQTDIAAVIAATSPIDLDAIAELRRTPRRAHQRLLPEFETRLLRARVGSR